MSKDDTLITDFVSGSTDPELFLPIELYDGLLSTGFGPGSTSFNRSAVRGPLVEYGFAHLISRLENEAQELSSNAAKHHDLPEDQRGALTYDHEYARAICRSLSRLRQDLGPQYENFTRYLYERVAPGRTVGVINEPDMETDSDRSQRCASDTGALVSSDSGRALMAPTWSANALQSTSQLFLSGCGTVKMCAGGTIKLGSPNLRQWIRDGSG